MAQISQMTEAEEVRRDRGNTPVQAIQTGQGLGTYFLKCV
jgi:hypothetical protein